MNYIKNIKHLSLGIITALFAVSGCNDDFVDTKPLVEVPSEDVWKDAGLAEAFINNIYFGLEHGGFDEQMLASTTDEAIFTHPGRGINTVTESRSNPADPGWLDDEKQWGAAYSRIRACNLAIEQLATPQFSDAAIAERLRGEALFMRAFYYHELLRYYGGVPIVDRSYELGEPDYLVERNTFEECVNFIVKDAEDAAQLLAGKTMGAGRATDAAALALKSRVLLYAASDLHDIPTASARVSIIASHSNPALFGYTAGQGGTRAERWQKAQAAAKAVLDYPGLGYMTDLAAPVTQEEGTTNYINASLSRNGGEREMIFGRYYISNKNEDGGRQGLYNGPNGYHNWAGNAPLQNLVDDYEMMDGTRFDWNNPVHASAPYANRDPRFYGSILYDGATWKPRPTDVAAKDPVMSDGGVIQIQRGILTPVKGVGQIQTGQYEIGSSGSPSTHFGLDTRQSSVEDWNGTRTGYYVRKFTDPNPNLIDQNAWQQVPWPFFRYTEAILNYVEASIELDQLAEASMWLNKIRFRVGMPAITETDKEALKQRYRNERRVEMAYEEQRYFDARRWMIPAETIGQKARIVNVGGKLKPGKNVTAYKYDPTSYDYTYTPLDIDPGIENRSWSDKMYFKPIHRDEINRNNKLAQNPGY